MPEDCLFCNIINGSQPASFVYEDDDVVAFLDTRPVNPGHTLVVPRRHAANLADLDPEDGAKVFKVAQQLAAAVRQSGVRCEGINLRLNDGVAAGQRVFHLHLHVMPRFEGDPLGLRPISFPLPTRDELEDIAAHIRDAVESVTSNQ